MGFFNNTLGGGETIFKNETALDPGFVPKLIPYREHQQRMIAAAIKPLFEKRTGRNMLIHGPPGVGKTVACKHVVNEIQEHTEEIHVVYVNCWHKNTSYQIALEICEILGYRLTHNKKSEELFEVVKKYINESSAVLIFDEVDKLQDYDFLYYLLEELYRKSIILITNYKIWLTNLDERIKSRLTAELLEFLPYNRAETKGILKERLNYAFRPGVWDEILLDTIVDKTLQQKDVRRGLYLLKEAGNSAEDRASKKVEKEDVQKAIEKLDEFTIKDPEELEDDTKFVLEIIKKNSGQRIGDLYKKYQEEGGKRVYKSFQRKIKNLEDGRFIAVTRLTGAGGNTSIINYKEQEKKLTEF